MGSCVSARTVARAFLSALHESRIDDARVLVLSCFDAKLDDAAVFWIVMRENDCAWLVEALASERPEVCKGSD